MTRPMYDYNNVQNRNKEVREEPILEHEIPVETFEAVEPVSEPAKKEPIEGKIYKCQLINVRTKPNLDGTIVTRLKKGDVVHVEDEVDGWYAITTGMGLEGYCLKDYVEV